MATAPIKPFQESRRPTAEQARWWRFRYPVLVTGDPAEQLPATWSPVPVHID
ncbi:hypothetical protein GCM10010254_20820 [Streptomyces chromofuscus]|nr:hypothetical protein GCM10010254_20820 [Streptomyces chromofuscus]